MPELPEVETVRRGLEPAMAGATILAVEQRRRDLRFPFPERFVQRLVGRRIERLTRRAKYLLAHLDSGEILVMHLGMTGRFTVTETRGGSEVPPTSLKTHDHVVFQLSSGHRIVYNDARRFGFMKLIVASGLSDDPLFREIGLEPLSSELDGAALARLFQRRAAPLKAALLDQKLIAGLGNIYVCEALYRSGLSPRRAAGTIATRAGLPTARADKLAVVIREVLSEAVEAGGSTLRDYAHTDGSLGYFQHSFNVYDREGESCKRQGCNGTVRRIVQSGRSSFYCPTCQR